MKNFVISWTFRILRPRRDSLIENASILGSFCDSWVVSLREEIEVVHTSQETRIVGMEEKDDLG
jgi:hypothetical protein